LRIREGSINGIYNISEMPSGNATRCRPKFGFGAESRQMASFGVASVSAETNKLAFGLLSVSAETDTDFPSSTEYLF
jgi:hypothetical protein